MSTQTQALPRTDLAAVRWSNGYSKEQIRVYFQDNNDGIRESRYDGTSWSGGTQNDVIGKAKPGSAIAAFSHQEDIHLYYISADNIIQEKTGSGWGSAAEWKDGPLTAKRIKAHSLSRLAALPYGSGIWVSVFYQKTNGYIGHLRRSDSHHTGWEDRDPFGPKAIQGTGLAALHPDPLGSAQIRVYFQQTDTSLTDFGVEDSGSFQQGILNYNNVSTNSSLSAVSSELYFLNSSNWLSEGTYYSSAWHFENHPDHTLVRPSSSVAVTLDHSGLHRAYIQDKDDQIVEYTFNKPWENGSKTIVPTKDRQDPQPYNPGHDSGDPFDTDWPDFGHGSVKKNKWDPTVS